MGRHRDAVERHLETAVGDPITVETVRGLADRWDAIEQGNGEAAGQIAQLASVLLQSAQNLSIPHEDALESLENALRAV